MIYLILLLLIIFTISFLWLFLRSIAIRETGSKKIKFSVKGIGIQSVLSKVLWSVVCTVAVVYCLSLILPLAWMLMSSVKGDFEFRLDPFGIPNPVYFSNYADILDRLSVTTGKGVTYSVADMLINSVIYAVGNSFKAVFWTVSVAYVIARFDFKFNRFLYAFGILIMMIPITGTLAASMILQKSLGLYDNMYAHLLVPPVSAFSGLNFMVLHGALRGIPKEYSEAARIDGASEYKIMYGIIIPMILPTCLTIFILSFVGLWNSYSEFLIYFPSTPNLAYGMYYFQYRATAGSAGNAATMPMILAGLTLCMIPSLIIYLSAQKIMRSNFTVGGIKG
ncbi:MAG: carbohydrate ABC transporter permease [Clostridia bacterium]|nr:carbohydrate ABC transporter permease [Clostridia bacterium]